MFGIIHLLVPAEISQKSGQIPNVGGNAAFVSPLLNNIPTKINISINATVATDKTIMWNSSIIEYIDKFWNAEMFA